MKRAMIAATLQQTGDKRRRSIDMRRERRAFFPLNEVKESIRHTGAEAKATRDALMNHCSARCFAGAASFVRRYFQGPFIPRIVREMITLGRAARAKLT